MIDSIRRAVAPFVVAVSIAPFAVSCSSSSEDRPQKKAAGQQSSPASAASSTPAPSAPAAPTPAPARSPAPAPAATPAPATPAPANVNDDNRPLEPITIRKGDRRGSDSGPLKKPQKGNVSIDFKDVDLANLALPQFSAQAGFIVEYSGQPKKITLRLEDVAWRVVLVEICRFTQTHAVQSQVTNRLELKPGFADSTPFLDKWDPEHGSREVPASTPYSTPSPDTKGTSSSSGTTGGTSGSSGSSGASASSDNIDDPNAKGKGQIEKLRTGVNTTNSGGR